ncbi:MAG TPA: hypothetical protein EYG68_06370 [Leucothrix mucor]|nr:hypothetical protein [Leucothrix mucor]
MSDKRQVYRVILQLMTYIGIAALLWVMFGSVFVPDYDKSSSQTEYMEVTLQNLAEGKVTHVMWRGKIVSILHRSGSAINEGKASRYFVYYDLGDSGNCPLYFTGEVLKDTCTGTQYDQFGQPVNRIRADDLESPLHYFSGQKKLVLGKIKKSS